MARKKKKDENGFTEYKKLFIHQFSEHTKALADINRSIDQLRKDVLEQAIPDVKQDIASMKGKASIIAIVLSLACGGAVSAAIAFFS